MTFTIKTLRTGPLDVNCYILQDKETDCCVIIDPGGRAEDILKYLAEKKLQLKYILLTHGHGDHLGAVDALRQACGAAVMIHQGDAAMLPDAQKNFSAFMNFACEVSPADAYVNDGQEIVFGNSKLKVIHTPGHSPGSVCYGTDEVLFSGDTLFAGAVGRCDLPGGSVEVLKKTAREKLLSLSDGLRVYPGHGPETTLVWEKQHNDFLLNI